MLAKGAIEFYKKLNNNIFFKKGTNFCNIAVAIKLISIQKNIVFYNKMLKKQVSNQ